MRNSYQEKGIKNKKEYVQMKKNFLNGIMRKVLVVVICFAVALFSIFVVAKKATEPETYKNTIQSIDEKKVTVMGVAATAAIASTALASVVGDATTPVANEIMDIGSYLLIVVCALVLEKSLLTVFGYISFKILIPVACVLFAISVFAKRSLLKLLSLKIVVFALVLSTVIPFSLKISDLIYETNMSTVQELDSKVEGIDSEESNKKDNKKSWWDKLKDKAKEGTSKVIEKAKDLLNNFIDVIALFIIAYCAIPIIVFLVVIWLVKFLFNITIPIPSKDKLKVFHKKEMKTEWGEQKEDD